jgi:hypothetical protein
MITPNRWLSAALIL